MGMDEASIDRVALGRAVMHYTHRCLEVAEKTIARLGEKFKISHVRYSETIKTPKETCRRVYKMVCFGFVQAIDLGVTDRMIALSIRAASLQAGVPYTDKYDAALDAYLLQSEAKRAALKQRNNTAAVHVYRPEVYGLSAAQIRGEFAAYISKYC
jgi:hypothetical protein